MEKRLVWRISISVSTFGWSEKVKTYIHPALLLVVVWCVGGIFWHTLSPLVPIEHGFNTTAYLSTVDNNVHPSMTKLYPFSDATSSKKKQHFIKLELSQTSFLTMTMDLNGSTVTISQPSGSPLGCDGTEDWHMTNMQQLHDTTQIWGKIFAVAC